MATDPGQPLDVEALLEKLRRDVKRTRSMADRLGAESRQLEGGGERLITNVAESLSTLRAIAGLPHKDADQFKQTIKERQRQPG
jgi:hypothetical protein